jgi:hypothetical protein
VISKYGNERGECTHAIILTISHCITCSTPPTKLSPRGLRPNFERELAEVWKLIFRSTLWFPLACSLVLEMKAEYMLVSDGGTGFDSHLLYIT